MKNRIGIVGGGQLAKMLIFEAKKMGFYTIVLDPTQDSPGGQLADEHIVASLNDEKAMRQLFEKVDYITLEWEMADDILLEKFQKKGIPVNPSPSTLHIIKDKLLQKEFLRKNKIPVGEFAPVESLILSEVEESHSINSFQLRSKNKIESATSAGKDKHPRSDNIRQQIIAHAKIFGYPLLLKARTEAYDGRGNALIKNEKGIEVALKKLEGRQLYVEKFVAFTKEISVIAARSMKEDIRMFPISENIHQDSILHTTIVPAKISKTIQTKAISLARRIMKILQGAGVFSIEMFVDKKGDVLVNEIAPRVHNSGHYTIEGCVTSQFEQHIRAISNLPLGNTALKAQAVAMINILGERNGEENLQGLEEALRIPNVSVHIYGKHETRIGRKMGHITVVGRNVKEALDKATKARKMMTI